MRKVEDIAGQRFGMLVAKEYVGIKNGHAMWLCQCDCGKTKEISSNNLRKGTAKSCGCSREKQKDVLVGNVYGKLTVISTTEKRTKSGNLIWLCRCECGNTKEVSGDNLKRGHAKSCGCLAASRKKKNAESKQKEESER